MKRVSGATEDATTGHNMHSLAEKQSRVGKCFKQAAVEVAFPLTLLKPGEQVMGELSKDTTKRGGKRPRQEEKTCTGAPCNGARKSLNESISCQKILLHQLCAFPQSFKKETLCTADWSPHSVICKLLMVGAGFSCFVAHFLHIDNFVLSLCCEICCNLGHCFLVNYQSLVIVVPII